jgi:hypothetical protein
MGLLDLELELELELGAAVCQFDPCRGVPMARAPPSVMMTLVAGTERFRNEVFVAVGLWLWTMRMLRCRFPIVACRLRSKRKGTLWQAGQWP